jgi:hypothetical protein
MAKLGRYSADRKKIEAITADKTVEVSDCGTVFSVDASSAVELTLPTVAAAGKGWWIKVVTTDTTAATTVVTAGSENKFLGYVLNRAEDNDAITVTSDADGDTITLAAGSIPGATVEFICDGTFFLVQSSVVLHATSDTAGTITKAS